MCKQEDNEGQDKVIEPNPCVTYGSNKVQASDFCNVESIREYMISGMCQKCQDEVFNDDDDDYEEICKECGRPYDNCECPFDDDVKEFDGIDQVEKE